MRDHGGNIDEAIAAFGGGANDWIDLSTGINRRPYSIPPLPSEAWTALPTKHAREALCEAAAEAYGTTHPILPVAGAQAAIQLIPGLGAPGDARILAPTYNEHHAALLSAGWQVRNVGSRDELAGADLAVIVNPNNPDGRCHKVRDILETSQRVGRLIVDESFADAWPKLSAAPHAGENLLVLRSFGKFYGLAGIRLGFVIGDGDSLSRLAEMAGPWAVSGPALAIGRIALADTKWREETTRRLNAECRRLDAIAKAAGWPLEGGTELFRTYRTPDAAHIRDHFARHQIWSRIFPYSETWLRLGLPGNEAEWARLERAISAQ